MKTNTKKTASKTPSAHAKLQADLDAAKGRRAELSAFKKAQRAVKAAAPKVAKAKPAAKVKEPAALVPTTVSGTARKLILDGRSNEQVLDALMALFPGFDVATKKHYPGWYRAELVRKGVLSKKQAAATAH